MIEKTISTIYVRSENGNKAVAEVIENPGCGFEWLIRIDPEYKNNIEVFEKCLKICEWVFPYDFEQWKINYINKSFDRGYLIDCESIALICDKVI